MEKGGQAVVANLKQFKISPDIVSRGQNCPSPVKTAVSFHCDSVQAPLLHL